MLSPIKSFRQEFLSGVFYTFIGKYIGLLVSIVVTMILARILEPSDFGIIAVAIVIINFLNLLTDFGLGPAIVQNDNLSDTDIKSLFNFTFILGLFGSVFLFLMSESIALFYNNSQLVNVIKVLSINILFISLNTIPNAQLIKKKKFRSIASRTLSIQTFAGVTAIMCACGGIGIYALVIQQIIMSIGTFLYNYIVSPIKIEIILRLDAIKKIIRFSLFQFLSSIISFFSKELDKLMVGKKMELSQLGYYEKSYRLIQLPVNNLVSVFTPVIQPLFKEINRSSEFEKKFHQLVLYLSLFSFPLSAFLFFSSQDVIYLFFGPKWDPAITPFKMLSLAIGFKIVQSTYMPIFQASGNVKTMFVISLAEFLVTLLCLSVGLIIGTLKSVALMLSIGAIIHFVIATLFVGASIYAKHVGALCKSILQGIFIAMICSLCLLLSSFLFRDMSYPIIRLIFNIIILVVVVLFALNIMGLLDWRTVVNKIRQKKRK